jgi:hypothetical protein
VNKSNRSLLKHRTKTEEWFFREVNLAHMRHYGYPLLTETDYQVPVDRCIWMRNTRMKKLKSIINWMDLSISQSKVWNTTVKETFTLEIRVLCFSRSLFLDV